MADEAHQERCASVPMALAATRSSSTLHFPARGNSPSYIISWFALFALIGSLGAVALLSDPLSFSVLACVWSLANFVRLPLPVGDPMLVVVGSHSMFAAVLCFGLTGWFAYTGNKSTAAIFTSAAVLFMYKRWCTSRAVAVVRAQFAEVGVTLASQDYAQRHLDRTPAPLPMRVSPIGSVCVCDGTVLPGRVTVRKQEIVVDGATNYVDVWQNVDRTMPGRPIFFFIHGGSWKGMSPRCNAATRTLHAIATMGWIVVACSYRKKRWPEHVDDSYAALSWTLANLIGVSSSSRLVIAGNSAGGHLATLITLRAIEEGISVHGCVLGYPAVDPYDEDGNYFFLPFGCRRGRSLLACFFEMAVLRGRTELWDTARPLLHRFDAYPPTLIMHGSLDSIVPLEQSKRFFTALTSSRTYTSRPRDLLLEVPHARHSFEIGKDVSAQAALAGLMVWLEGVLEVGA